MIKTIIKKKPGNNHLNGNKTTMNPSEPFLTLGSKFLSNIC